jgi:hypothetical protein
MTQSKNWSKEEVETLVRLYGEGMSFSNMRSESTLLAARYKSSPMSLRDKIFSLQKERIKLNLELGELEKALPSEKYDYRNYAKKLEEGGINVRKRKEFETEMIKDDKSLKKSKTDTLSEYKKKMIKDNTKIKVGDISATVDALIDDLKEEISVFPKMLKIRYNEKCGLLLGQAREIEFSKECFKKINNCRCDIACSIRWYHNMWRKRDLWFPLCKEEVEEEKGKLFESKNYNTQKSDVLYFHNSEKKMEMKMKLSDDDYNKMQYYKRTLLESIEDTFYEKVMSRMKKKSKLTKNYLSMILHIKKSGVLNSLSTPELIIKKLEHYELQTLNKKIYVIRLFIENLTYQEKLELIGYDFGLSLEYIQRMYGYFLKEIEIRYESQEKTEKEEKNWMPWNELQDLLPRVYIEGTDQEYLAFLLMTRAQTLRNDYSTLKFKKDGMDDEIDEEIDNYVDLDKNMFVWNNYKTDQEYKRLEMKIVDDTVIKELLKFGYRRTLEKKDYIFEGFGKSQMKRQEFGVMLNNLTERLTGKRIGSQMMRKIMVSSARKNDLSLSDSKELAKNAMHSVRMSSSVYRKM